MARAPAPTSAATTTAPGPCDVAPLPPGPRQPDLPRVRYPTWHWTPLTLGAALTRAAFWDRGHCCPIKSSALQPSGRSRGPPMIQLLASRAPRRTGGSRCSNLQLIAQPRARFSGGERARKEKERAEGETARKEGARGLVGGLDSTRSQQRSRASAEPHPFPSCLFRHMNS